MPVSELKLLKLDSILDQLREISDFLNFMVELN